MSPQKAVCQICGSFRELTLHLHELGKFCELLDNEQTLFKSFKKGIVECGVAKTQSIAKWLRLASQLESVEMNTFRYEEAHFYCEPVANELNSNANHDSSIATQITRFLFISIYFYLFLMHLKRLIDYQVKFTNISFIDLKKLVKR